MFVLVLSCLVLSFFALIRVDPRDWPANGKAPGREIAREPACVMCLRWIRFDVVTFEALLVAEPANERRRRNCRWRPGRPSCEGTRERETEVVLCERGSFVDSGSCCFRRRLGRGWLRFCRASVLVGGVEGAATLLCGLCGVGESTSFLLKGFVEAGREFFVFLVQGEGEGEALLRT